MKFMIKNQNDNFSFKTKAETLSSLKPILKNAKILPQISFKVHEWKNNKNTIIAEIKKLKSPKIIVRSSALSEDTQNESKAGNYESIGNIDIKNNKDIENAVNEVIKSYLLKDKNLDPNNQILVQPMLTNVSMCGVAFTRDIETGAPYIIINYDNSGSTDSVTAGSTNNLNIFTYYKYSKILPSNEKLRKVILLCQELEKISGNTAIDVEFAITEKNLYLLQARPIAAIKHKNFTYIDSKIDESIEECIKFFNERNVKYPNISGDRAVYGIMPDWNPAEIIGISPRPLALSLYKEIITDTIWPLSRAKLGYKDVGFHPGLVSFAGKPYIDVRMSFNSFLPANIEEGVANKLVNFYLNKLINNPDSHDKIEFEIVYTAYKFGFEKEIEEMQKNNFSPLDIKNVKNSLLELTNNVINEININIDEEIDKAKILSDKRQKIIFSQIPIESKIAQLIHDCKYYGTLPFSNLARLGFFANILMRSLLEKKIITYDEYTNFFSSVSTVAEEFIESLNDLKGRKISKKIFLEKFGHLRPGTYDIMSQTYRENFDEYLNLDNLTLSKHEECKFEFSDETKSKIQKAIEEEGFTFDVNKLLIFSKKATEARELSKFEFTRNLSLVLEYLEELLFYEYGLTREDISYLEISDILKYATNSKENYLKEKFKQIIDLNKKRHKVTQTLRLPPLIYMERNINYFHMLDNRPNFVTKKTIKGDIAIVEAGNHSVDLNGKIVIIENADPGYDWIFSHNIAGLITKYGGVASHMSIRSAEFKLPAAIGCGQAIYDYVKKSKKIELNCQSHQIKRIL